MNNQRKVILIFGVLAVMGLLIWMLSSNDSSVEPGKGKIAPYVSSNWRKEYLEADKDPKGLYLFNKLLRTHIDPSREMSFITTKEGLDSVTLNTNDRNTYVFVGNRFGLESNEIDTLLQRVKGGSDLFLGYHALTENIISRLFERYGEVFDYNEEINVFMELKKLRMINLFQNDTVAKNWIAFDPGIVAKDSIVERSTFMELANLIELQHGKGKIYLTTTPELFQNYQIQRNHGFVYTKMVLELLPEDQDVHYLELGRLSDDYGTEDVDEQDGGEGKKDDSYLRIIFENRTLLKAFLFGILGILLFLLFRSKRLRPVVPYLEPKKNTTRAFMETLTSIYFSKRNPYGMLSLQRRNFYGVIQKHFFIDLSRREEDRELIALSEKSNVPLDELRRLVNLLETKEAFEVSDDTIVTVHKLKQEFYKKAGIVAEHVNERALKKATVVYRRLTVPAILLLVGIVALFYGFYLLVDAHGIGVALWPIGAFILFLAVRQIRKPLVYIDEDKFTYTPSFGRSRNFDRLDLIRAEWDDNTIQLLFKGQITITINQNEMGRQEKAKLMRALMRIKTDELW